MMSLVPPARPEEFTLISMQVPSRSRESQAQVPAGTSRCPPAPGNDRGTLHPAWPAPSVSSQTPTPHLSRCSWAWAALPLIEELPDA